MLVPPTGLSVQGPPMDWRHSRGSGHVFWLKPSAQSGSATLVHPLPTPPQPPRGGKRLFLFKNTEGLNWKDCLKKPVHFTGGETGAGEEGTGSRLPIKSMVTPRQGARPPDLPSPPPPAQSSAP